MAQTPIPGTPTQVAHPGKAIIRTFVASGVGIAVAWLARVLGIDFTELADEIVNFITIAVWGLVLGVVQWLLTHPKLLPFWETVGLGTGVENEPPALKGSSPTLTWDEGPRELRLGGENATKRPADPEPDELDQYPQP